MATRTFSNAHPVFDDDAETTVHDRSVLADDAVATRRAPEKCGVVAAAVIDVEGAPASQTGADHDGSAGLDHVVVHASADADVGDRPTVPSAEPPPPPVPVLLKPAPTLIEPNFTPPAMEVPIPPPMPRRRERGAPPSLFRGVNRFGAALSGLSLLVMIVVAAVLVVPRRGELRVAVSVERGSAPLAEVFVDGQLRCEVTPCVVRDLTPGDHAVVVRAPGFVAPPAEMQRVSAGRERQTIVALKPSTSGGVKAVSDQPGVRVFVDGVDRGALPIDVGDLSPGPHTVRFDGGAALVASEETLRLGPGEVKDLGVVRLSPRTADASRAE
ncbi:MAG TPA: hypothetical protein VGM56_23365 [Byssovorax sp.]|jgi:serine/threonine-protein kinase